MVQAKWLNRKRFHERTQRSIVRMLFLFAAALPTMCLCVWVIASWTPWYQSYRVASWNHWLSSQLGMHVSIQNIRTPSPNLIEFESIIISHPESDREVARVRLVEAFRSSQGWALRLAQPELQGAELTSCYKIVHDWFLCRPKSVQQAVVLAMNDLTIHGTSSSATLVDIKIDLSSKPDQVLSHMRFRLAGEPLESEARLDFSRSHRSKITHWQLQTGEQSFPCDIFSDYFHDLDKLGESARFTGTAWYKYGEDVSREARISGRLDRVQLDQLTQHLPYDLTGLAQLWLSDAVFANGRISSLKGRLYSSSGGRLDRRWISTAAESLGVTATNMPAAESTIRHLAFDAIGVDMELTTSGLVLHGIGDNPTLLSGPQGPLLTASGPIAAIPLTSVAEFLSGSSLSTKGVAGFDQSAARHTIAQYLPWPEPEGPKVSVVPTESNRLR
jgi:hypothetical protein